MVPTALHAIGWNSFFEAQLDAFDPDAERLARVSAHHGSEVVLHDGESEFRVLVQAAESDGKVAVGDWLLLARSDGRAIRRLERRTLLERKAAGEEVRSQIIVSNVDVVFIVTSCNENFNLSRLERYLAMALQAGATPVVVLTKADLCEDPGSLAERARSLHPGLDVEVLDARRPEQASGLVRWCGPGCSVALVGSSGVGKSTLANALGASEQITGDIREKDGKGRHTTTSRSLHLLPSGGVLVDNPGVREFQLPECEDGVEDLFEDVLGIIATCRFSNCAHESEPGCAVREAIDSGTLDERRFESYRKLMAEQERNAASLATRRDRERKMGKVYKSAKADKKRRRGDW